MLEVIGVAKLSNNTEIKDNYSISNIFWTEKLRDSEEFENFFVEAVFVGEAHKKLNELAETREELKGIKIAIVSGFLKQDKWTKDKKNYTKLKIMVRDFTEWVEEKKEENKVEKKAEKEAPATQDKKSYSSKYKK